MSGWEWMNANREDTVYGVRPVGVLPLLIRELCTVICLNFLKQKPAIWVYLRLRIDDFEKSAAMNGQRHGENITMRGF
ncbi:MAG: hypothetical protein RR816_00565, partial [Clostridia bacterium]